MVIEFHFFNQIKKEKNMQNICCSKYIYANTTNTSSQTIRLQTVLEFLFDVCDYMFMFTIITLV